MEPLELINADELYYKHSTFASICIAFATVSLPGFPGSIHSLSDG